MRSGKPLFLAIALVVIVAGCTSGSGSRVAFDQNAGVKINQFAPDVTELFDNDPITLTFEVQNVGGKSMTDKSKLWIYGPKIKASGSETWTISSADLTSSGMSLDSADGYLSKELDTTTFMPPNTERGIPGTVDVSEVVLKSPAVPENMVRDNQFFARVCYPYNTTSLTKLVATTKNQLRTETVANTDATTRASAGPIQIKVLSSENLVADRIAGGKMPIVVEVTDVGGGFATTQDTACTSRKPDISSKEINKVKLSVRIDDMATDCDSKQVTLIKGVGTTSCKLTTALGSATSAPKTEYTVTSTAVYNYQLTQSAQVTVKNQNL